MRGNASSVPKENTGCVCGHSCRLQAVQVQAAGGAGRQQAVQAGSRRSARQLQAVQVQAVGGAGKQQAVG